MVSMVIVLLGDVLAAADSAGAGSRSLGSADVLRRFKAGESQLHDGPLSSSEVIALLRNGGARHSGEAGGGSSQVRKQISEAEVVARIRAYVTPSETEVRQMFDFVAGAPHIRENALYANIMSKVSFAYSNNVDTVNSYATPSAVLCVLGGDARFSRLVGLAVAAYKNSDGGAPERLVKSLTAADCSRLGEKGFVELVCKAKLVDVFADEEALSTARGVSAGYLAFTIAHEAGHLSMAHVLSPGYGSKPLDISRNQEREADSFASSVIASSPFGEYVFIGRLFELYARASCEKNRRETTHPLSIERLQNLIKANPALASSLGICGESFQTGDPI